MPGWETSRHPEWYLMYSASLTVREIVSIAAHPAVARNATCRYVTSLNRANGPLSTTPRTR